jgi:uncharacterized membrane protein YidH (DUF202 family)
MNPVKAVGILLIVAGVLALAYGGFTYTRSSRQARVGPVVVSMQDKRTVAVPIWAGVGAIVVGGVVVLVPAGRKRRGT